MAKQILDEISLKLSKAIQIKDAFTGKAVINGIQIHTAGGYRPVFRPEGYCLFLNMAADSFEIEIISAVYQNRRLVLETDGGSKVQEIFLYPSAAYPVGRNTTVVSGQAPAGAALYFHLEEKRRECRLLRDYKKGEKEIAVFMGGVPAAAGGIWFIRDPHKESGEYFRATKPETEMEHHSLDHALAHGYRKKDAVLYPAFECMAGDGGDFYLYVNHLKEQEYRLFYSRMRDGGNVDGEIMIRGCVYNTVNFEKQVQSAP